MDWDMWRMIGFLAFFLLTMLIFAKEIIVFFASLVLVSHEMITGRLRGEEEHDEREVPEEDRDRVGNVGARGYR